MNLLHVRDLGDGHINVSWRRGNVEHECRQLIPLKDPLTEEDHHELRWYLEDYLEFPYGAEAYRAHKVEDKIIQWGTALFQQIFPKSEFDPDPRDLYKEALREGLNNCEFYISSDDPQFLSIPWEIIFDPAEGRGFLAHLLGGLYRQHVGQKISAALTPSKNQPFHILLVIARPFGECDIPQGTVARPMLKALRPLQEHLLLEVLRPPTFDALAERLNSQPGRYQLVHFDGHGSFVDADSSSKQCAVSGERGQLVFEKLDGSPDFISSQELGQLLANCNVPLFVLNACQSALVGRHNPFTSVASKLIATGANGVLAMSYSVYGSTASKFMQRFYESLVKHMSLAEAVTAGRRKLYAEPEHDSIAGKIDLWDWMVPALYQQENHYVPIPQDYTGTGSETSGRASLLRHVEEICPEGMFGFIGRNYDILRLERVLLDDRTPWVLITGVGGTGKTDLAYGFARWYAETSGCRCVFKTSFKEKADFGQVVGSIVGFGSDFSRQSDRTQWDRLVNYLQQEPCLLIWDNFETVNGYPAGCEPLAGNEDREKLGRFLRALRGGKSRVIITTRKPVEPWLGIAYNLLSIGGLTSREARQMAQSILKTIGKTPNDFRDDPNYARLIDLLRGHPRSLELVLTQLRFESPGEIIKALQSKIDSCKDLMDASFEYIFEHLSPETRRHLPLIGLFTTYAALPTVGLFSCSGLVQPVYKEHTGECLDVDGWKNVLMEAAFAGLIRQIQSDLFELHPTLPAFLRNKLAGHVGPQGVVGLDAKFMMFYAGLAGVFEERLKRAEPIVSGLVGFEEPNFLRALRLAELGANWSSTQAIVQLISIFYNIRSRHEELRSLRSSILARLGRTINASSSKDKFDLWMFLQGEEANDAIKFNDLNQAEMDYERILGYLVSLKDPNVDPKIAICYNKLGIIAAHRHKLDEAEQWHKKALEIFERPGLEQDAAAAYHQLGIIDQKLHNLNRAEMWYKKALKIYERLGLEPNAAKCYHQLGMVAQDRQKSDEAEQWYGKALEIHERLGMEQEAAAEYTQLGSIAYLRRMLDEAEQWYKKALKIRERLALELDATKCYHGLGMVAQYRHKLDEAEQWYKKALEIYKHRGLELDAADMYILLGIINQNLDEAYESYRDALDVYDRLNNLYRKADTLALMGILRKQQDRLEEAMVFLGRAWIIAREYQMSIIESILLSLASLMLSMGEQEFVTSWRQAFHEEPPLEALHAKAR